MRELKNLKIEQIYYCGYSSMAILASAYNIDFLGDILGTEWGFRLEKRVMRELGVEYEKYHPEYFISSEVTPVKTLLYELYGIQIKCIEKNNSVDFWNELNEQICKQNLILVMVDCKYLNYFEEYRKYHPETAHCVVVFDINSDYVKFLDTSRGFVEGYEHSMQKERFLEAVLPSDNPLGLNLSLYMFEKVCKKKLTHDELKEKFRNSLKSMLRVIRKNNNGIQSVVGIEALNELKKEFDNFVVWNNKNLINRFRDDIFSMIVLIVQQRKANYKFIKKYYADNIDLILRAKKIYQLWNNLEITLANIRKEENELVFEKAKNIIGAIYQAELNFIISM